MDTQQKVKKIRRLAPCPNFDVERIESWLQDMAKEGWLLEKEGNLLGFFTFAKAAPQTVRYRLELKGKGDGFGDVPAEDLQALCEEYGWEYVDSYSQFYIYRSTRPDAREMNTDLQVQAAALKAMKLDSAASVFCEAISLFFVYSGFFQEPARYLVTFGLAYNLVLLIFIIWCSAEVILRAVHIRRLQKQLKANIPLDHNKPWKQGALFHIVSKIAYVLFTLLLFGILFGSCARASGTELTDTSDYPGDPPFVTFADLCPEGEFTTQRFLSGYNAYSAYSTYFGPRIIEWKEYGELINPGGDTIQGSLLVDYYETTSPLLARGLLEGFLQDAKRYDDEFSELEAPDIGVNYVVAYHRIYPTILIQHENVFIKASVPLELNGEQILLEQWAQLMAAMLLETYNDT